MLITSLYTKHLQIQPLSLGRSRSRNNQTQSTVGRNTLDALRVLMSRVASILSGRRRRSDQSQRARNFSADSAGRVAVSWVAGVGGLSSGSDEGKSALGGDAFGSVGV
jgi:hypothetical protein